MWKISYIYKAIEILNYTLQENIMRLMMGRYVYSYTFVIKKNQNRAINYTSNNNECMATIIII